MIPNDEERNPMQIRDRVKEFRRVRAKDLRPNARNWRVHPASQRNALQGVLAEIGFAGALLARELADGTLELLDGHLRAETLSDAMLPVLVLDLNDDEAAKLLATYDPISALAETNHAMLAELTQSLTLHSEEAQGVITKLLAQNPEIQPLAPEVGAVESPLPASYQIVIDCENEAEQQVLYEQLTADGRECRLLVL
jgi:hypothetical protein